MVRRDGSDKELGRLLYELFVGEGCVPKTLVTGGNIGNYVAEGLANRTFPVRVLARRVKPNPFWDDLGIEQVSGDFSHVSSLASAFDGVDRFFSLSPMVENLVELGRNAVTAAKQAGVDYIVRSSAMGSNAEIAHKFTNALGKKIAYVDVTPEKAKESMANSGMSPWMIQCQLELFAISKAGYVAEVSPVVKEVLKRNPISFDQFLEENVAAFRVDREIAGVARTALR